MASYRVAADVGGTFTDFFIYEEKSGAITIVKVPSTPENPALGIMAGLKKVGLDLRQTRFFAHGTTVGTNALITRRYPRTALITTKGFRDVHEIKRATREDLWDAYKDEPPPYIRRRDRLEVEERVDYSGRVLTPLNVEEAVKVSRVIRKRGIASVAVCFINAYMNGENEAKMKEILRREHPDAYVCTSSEVAPQIFEHERSSTTIINACLAPVVGKYLNELSARLSEEGYGGDVLILHSGGGVMTASTAADFAARVANSGPAAGAVAGSFIARSCGFDNSIGLDMGGTSADVSLMYRGELSIANEWWVEHGYPILFPSVETISIGAGGGSVAWIDEGGSLRVGPQSMGADPGPACYLKGGKEPTTTDANLILERLSAENFLGGEVRISREAAEKAVKKIADRLGYDVVEAADAIIRVVNSNMCDAIRLVSVKKGYDPRDFPLVVFGGAGPLHGASLARELEIPTVIVPPWPGITSALGCLLIDIRHDLSKPFIAIANDVEPERVEREFAALEREAAERLRREGFGEESMLLTRSMDLMYTGQWRTLTVQCPRPISDMDAVCEKFHEDYERAYAYKDVSQRVQIFQLRLTALGLLEKVRFPTHSREGRAEEALKGVRKVYFEGRGFLETAVYDRARLKAGAQLEGPAIVEQPDSTILVPPKVKAEVDERLNILMRLK